MKTILVYPVTLVPRPSIVSWKSSYFVGHNWLDMCPSGTNQLMIHQLLEIYWLFWLQIHTALKVAHWSLTLFLQTSQNRVLLEWLHSQVDHVCPDKCKFELLKAQRSILGESDCHWKWQKLEVLSCNEHKQQQIRTRSKPKIWKYGTSWQYYWRVLR